MFENYYKKQLDRIDKSDFDEIRVKFTADQYDGNKSDETKWLSLNQHSAKAIVDKLTDMYKLDS